MDATVYGTKTCTWCEQVIRALKKHTTSTTKIDVNEADNLEEMKKFAGENARTVPQVVINGKYIGGYTEVDRYLRSLVPVEEKPEIDRG